MGSSLLPNRPRASHPAVSRAAALVVAGLLCAAPAAGLAGCAGKKKQPDPPQSNLVQPGTGGPLVISGTPRADTAAFNNASRSLLKSQHGVIEDMGPKPSWRRIRNGRDVVQSRAVDAGDPEQGIPSQDSTAIGALGRRNSKDGAPETPGPIEDPLPGPVATGERQASPALSADPLPVVDAPGELGPMTTTRLAAIRASAEAMAAMKAALQPGTTPQQPVLDFDDLPISRLPLPDGRLRLIWHLRSFGGPKVVAGGNMVAGNVGRRSVTLTPADLAPLVAVVQGHLADKGQVLPLPNENKLVITCPADMEQDVLALMNELDVPPAQVEITAKIFEVSHDFDYQQGARILLNRMAEDGTQQALSSFQTQRLLDATATGAPFQGSVISLLQTFSEAGISLDASFELLAEAGLIHIVSSPRLTVAEGQTGYMLAGQELPIQSANLVNNILQTTTSYKPVGVQLYITPQAIGDGLIKLHTVSIVSSVAGFSPLPTIRGSKEQNPLLMNPIIDSREAETAVTVPEGETLVISGMRMVRTTTREDKVPGLGDIPIVGNLFKNHRSQQRMTDLYFFVTPTLASAE